MYEFAASFAWPHGPVDVRARHSQGGLINAIIEGWYPRSDDREWAFFLEDDIEVSRMFFRWAQNGRAVCENDALCIGVSLYSPMLNELVWPKTVLTSKLREADAAPAYTAQVPCSWGAVYKPGPWRTFRRWAAHQPREHKYGGDLNLGRASGWAASWKRYLLELMLVKDWTLLYPFVNNEHAGYSTNHLELGEHIKKHDDKGHRREQYELPLLTDEPPVLSAIPMVRFDHLYHPIAMRFEDARVERRRRGDLPRTQCQAYSVQGHRELFERDTRGVTVVITFFYSKERFLALMRNTQTYCSYSVVKRIIIVWHNRDFHPPTMAFCNQKRSTTVHFVYPRVPDSLSNRFIPTYRVLTETVITVDDDILVSERDIVRMVTVLIDSGFKRVVGPFPRWYERSTTNHFKYLYKPSESPSAHPNGYAIILTKIHVSSFDLYYHCKERPFAVCNRVHDRVPTHAHSTVRVSLPLVDYCDEQYEDMRQFVRVKRNAEDLLYIKVAADRFCPPSLFVVTADDINDSGMIGLHSKSGHNQARSEMLEMCGYNSSFWSYDVVLPPGTRVTEYDHKHYRDQHARVRQ